MQGYRFFCNKLWNAVKFSLTYLTGDIDVTSEVSSSYMQVVNRCSVGGGKGDVRTVLNGYLADHSYLDGYSLSETDHIVFQEVVSHGVLDSERLPHLSRWVNHIRACRQGGGGTCRGNFLVRLAWSWWNLLNSACNFIFCQCLWDSN